MASFRTGLVAALLGFGLVSSAIAQSDVSLRPASSDSEERDLIVSDGATLRGLDKISGRAVDRMIMVDETVIFGSLKVTLKACHYTPPEDTPESIAYLQIEDLGVGATIDPNEIQAADPSNLVFGGWMFASSPGINGLEHPVYDVWVIECNAIAPDIGDIFDGEAAVTNDPGSVEEDAVIEALIDEDEAERAASENSFDELLDTVEPSQE